jgi:hypothetical protein
MQQVLSTVYIAYMQFNNEFYIRELIIERSIRDLLVDKSFGDVR